MKHAASVVTLIVVLGGASAHAQRTQSLADRSIQDSVISSSSAERQSLRISSQLLRLATR